MRDLRNAIRTVSNKIYVSMCNNDPYEWVMIAVCGVLVIANIIIYSKR